MIWGLKAKRLQAAAARALEAYEALSPAERAEFDAEIARRRADMSSPGRRNGTAHRAEKGATNPTVSGDDISARRQVFVYDEPKVLRERNITVSGEPL